MTVVNGECDHGGWAKGNKTCRVCDEPVFYPFLYWCIDGDERDILICSSCCSKMCSGFQADLVQINATVELQKLYPNFTLERRRAPNR
jgi:hypothetical protein